MNKTRDSYPSSSYAIRGQQPVTSSNAGSRSQGLSSNSAAQTSIYSLQHSDPRYGQTGPLPSNTASEAYTHIPSTIGTADSGHNQRSQFNDRNVGTGCAVAGADRHFSRHPFQGGYYAHLSAKEGKYWQYDTTRPSEYHRKSSPAPTYQAHHQSEIVYRQQQRQQKVQLEICSAYQPPFGNQDMSNTRSDQVEYLQSKQIYKRPQQAQWQKSTSVGVGHSTSPTSHYEVHRHSPADPISRLPMGKEVYSNSRQAKCIESSCHGNEIAQSFENDSDGPRLDQIHEAELFCCQQIQQRENVLGGPPLKSFKNRVVEESNLCCSLERLNPQDMRHQHRSSVLNNSCSTTRQKPVPVKPVQASNGESDWQSELLLHFQTSGTASNIDPVQFDANRLHNYKQHTRYPSCSSARPVTTGRLASSTPTQERSPVQGSVAPPMEHSHEVVQQIETGANDYQSFDSQSISAAPSLLESEDSPRNALVDPLYYRSLKARVLHRTAETQRRKKMADLFNELRSKTPICKRGRESKCAVISTAIQYISSFNQEHQTMTDTIRSLQIQIAHLRKEEHNNQMGQSEDTTIRKPTSFAKNVAEETDGTISQNACV